MSIPKEIERKFLVKEIPDLNGITPILYERYYTSRTSNTEERVQMKGGVYEYQRKQKISDLEHKKETRKLTHEEFEELKKGAEGPIIREGFTLKTDPEISIKIYHGDYEGFVRAEIEFDSLEEARAFVPLPWMGREITGEPIAKDATLLSVSPKDLTAVLYSYND